MYRCKVPPTYPPNTTYPGPRLGSGGLWIYLIYFDIISTLWGEKRHLTAQMKRIWSWESLNRIRTVPGPDPWLEELAVVKCWCLHTWESLFVLGLSQERPTKSPNSSREFHTGFERYPLSLRILKSHHVIQPTGKWVSPCSSKRTIWEECTASFSIITWGEPSWMYIPE